MAYHRVTPRTLCACVCVCVHAHTKAYMCVRVCVCVCVCVCVHAHVHTLAQRHALCVCEFVCVCEWVCVWMFIVYMSLFANVCVLRNSWRSIQRWGTWCWCWSSSFCSVTWTRCSLGASAPTVSLSWPSAFCRYHQSVFCLRPVQTCLCHLFWCGGDFIYVSFICV